jgi:amidase
MPAHIALNELSATDAAKQIAEGKITSEALVASCLDRIAQREPAVKAWSAIDADIALAQARACDRAEKRGPLHGVPVGVKDVIDTYDLPTQMGSPIYAGHKSFADAACVAVLRRAGAVILGKTVTAEFAGMAPGATANPLDLKRTPGGSSSGSGAAVADDMVPAAFGTQTGGSILRPAAYCGVVGFKPSYGIVNRSGLKFAAESFDTIGMIARSVDDIDLFMNVLVGRPANQPPATSGKLPRIGICRTHLWHKALPETVAAMERTTAALAAHTHVVDVIWPDRFAVLSEAREVINDYERARALAYEWANFASQISPQMTRCIKRGWATEYGAYVGMLRAAQECREQLPQVFEGVDVLLTPAVNGEAPEGLDYTGEPAFQGIWTALHVPTITIPAGKGPNGLPVGLQLVAPSFADFDLLAYAKWIAATIGRAD